VEWRGGDWERAERADRRLFEDFVRGGKRLANYMDRPVTLLD
jgi:hypothetical protein